MAGGDRLSFLKVDLSEKGYIMQSNKNSKQNRDQSLEICLEFVPSKDGQRRLLQAFEMLLEDKDSCNLTRQARMLELNHKKK